MTFTPRSYQRKAIDQVADALGRCLLLDGGSERIVVLKAPTGSGKTVMLGLALDAAHRRMPERPFVTLWLTPGEADLYTQSSTRLAEVLNHRPADVVALTTSFLATNRTAKPGTILVANWEKLVNWDRALGDWSNHLTRSGEQRNLFELLQSCEREGTGLVVVFDESHTNMSGSRAKQLLSAIRDVMPFVEVHASATPRELELSQGQVAGLAASGRYTRITVPFEDVVSEGMVKRTVELNLGIRATKEAYPDLNSEQLALQAAWDKLQELEAAFSSQGSAVRPLLLVQVPNADQGNQRLASTIEFFTDAGLQLDEELAIWLSDDKKKHGSWPSKTGNLENIADWKNPARVLLFKQAVGTGWDCPRAHILVQFRETNSRTFAIQTLGRILRMPEHTHYEDDRLNQAYVYSDLPDDTITVRSDDEPERTILDATLVRRGDLYGSGLGLTSIWAPRQRAFDYVSYRVREFLEPRLDQVFADIPTNPVGSVAAEVLRDVSIDTEKLATLARELDIAGDTLELNLSEERTRVLFEALLVSDIRPFPSSSRRDSRPRLKTVVHRWFQNNRPNYDASERAAICLDRGDALSAAIHEACEELAAVEEADAIKNARAQRVVNNEWELPAEQRAARSTLEEARGSFILAPALARPAGSEEERHFEQWLAAQGSGVRWWWRNGERDKTALAIPYPDSLGKGSVADASITYPDYLVMTDQGLLWVVEIKGVKDRDGDVGGPTHRKAIGLAAWADRMSKRPQVPALLPAVRSAVVVPYESGEAIVVKAAVPENWKPPTQLNLADDSAWVLFGLE